MRDLKRTLRDLWEDEVAATMVEYVLLVALIALVAAVGFASFGTALRGKTDGVATTTTEILTP